MEHSVEIPKKDHNGPWTLFIDRYGKCEEHYRKSRDDGSYIIPLSYQMKIVNKIMIQGSKNEAIERFKSVMGVDPTLTFHKDCTCSCENKCPGETAHYFDILEYGDDPKAVITAIGGYITGGGILKDEVVFIHKEDSPEVINAILQRHWRYGKTFF